MEKDEIKRIQCMPKTFFKLVGRKLRLSKTSESLEAPREKENGVGLAPRSCPFHEYQIISMNWISAPAVIEPGIVTKVQSFRGLVVHLKIANVPGPILPIGKSNRHMSPGCLGDELAEAIMYDHLDQANLISENSFLSLSHSLSFFLSFFIKKESQYKQTRQSSVIHREQQRTRDKALKKSDLW